MMKAVRNSEQPGHRERARLGSIQFPARPWNTARTSRGTFCCACSVNFQFNTRDRWYVPASVSRSRIAKVKKQENTLEKTMVRVFETTVLLILSFATQMEAAKS